MILLNSIDHTVNIRIALRDKIESLKEEMKAGGEYNRQFWQGLINDYTATLNAIEQEATARLTDEG